MLKYDYFNNVEHMEDSHRDPCDIFEEQRAYVFALGLTNACCQIGK
ncbi:MAG: hypothetical protein J1F68_02295 [Clostridiales bacterium]|nr:hypothetical protein [Clostridiales bacterium]